MKTLRNVVITLVVLSLLPLATACSGGSKSVTVFAGSASQPVLQEAAAAFKKKTGVETLKIDVQPVERGTHPHMDNFLECVRSRQQPNLPAQLGYQAMAAIGMGVQAYRQSEVLFFDRNRLKVTTKPIGT